MADFSKPYVLAGFDGPPPSVRALRWAAKEARLRGLPILVCHAWHPPYPPPPAVPARMETGREAARLILEKGLLIAREAAPHTPVQGVLQAGPAPSVLANQTSGASLAVIGAHEPASFGRVVSHSPAVRLPAYAHCPVIVVREVTAANGAVVVGVDGSAASESALAFGYEEAALHERPIHIVYACGEPETSVGGRMAARIALERLTTPWREKYPAVVFEESLVALPPKEALCRAAEGAGLLVVGGRGLGDVGGFRLGPVSDALVRNAPCSVAVVRRR